MCEGGGGGENCTLNGEQIIQADKHSAGMLGFIHYHFAGTSTDLPHGRPPHMWLKQKRMCSMHVQQNTSMQLKRTHGVCCSHPGSSCHRHALSACTAA